MSSRTMKLTHKGKTIMVREGHTGQIEFVTNRVQPIEVMSKTFEAATNEARKWLLANAGEMAGTYDRSTN